MGNDDVLSLREEPDMIRSKHRVPGRAAVIVAFALAGGLAACGASDEPSATSSGSDTTSEPQAYADQWEKIEAPEECMCADGSPWAWFVREADPEKVVFYLEGGGACFNAQMCAPGSGTYKEDVGHDGGFSYDAGIFDLDNPDNPLADYSMVFVPYCTGDVHAGNLTKDYGNGVVVEHKGFLNATTALEAMAEKFPGARTLVVSGSSAGAFPTPIFAGLAAELLPEAQIAVVADSGGAIPDAMSFVVSNWGTLEAIPDWPEFEGITAADLTPAFSFITAAERNPTMTFARLDYAFDEVLSNFARLAGLSPDDLVGVMKAGEARIEAAGARVAAWVAPGDSHTVLASPSLYTETLNGVSLLDWLSGFLLGEPLEDQYCQDCAG